MLTGNIVVPRLCFLNVARSTASDLYAHNMLWINSFTLSSSPDYKKNNKTPKPLQLTSTHYFKSMNIHFAKLEAHILCEGTLATSLWWHNNLSWKNTVAVVVWKSLSNTVEQIWPVNGLTRLVRPVQVVKQWFTSRTIGELHRYLHADDKQFCRIFFVLKAWEPKVPLMICSSQTVWLVNHCFTTCTIHRSHETMGFNRS